MTCVSTMNKYGNYAIAAAAGAVGFLAVQYGSLVGPKVARFVCRITEHAVHYGRPLTDFSRTSPLHGIIAGIGISLLANAFIIFFKNQGKLEEYPLLRRTICHILAGALVFGVSAAAAHFGLVATTLTLASATTLTACALLIDILYRQVIVWINQGKPPLVDALTQVPPQRA